MPVKRPAPGRARADRDARAATSSRALQLEAPAVDAARTPTRTCRTTGASSMRPACIRDDLQVARGPRASFRSRPSRTCATTIRSACSPCRASRSCASTRRSGTTGKPTVVGYTRKRHRHLGRRDGALDPRGRAARRATSCTSRTATACSPAAWARTTAPSGWAAR